MWEFLGTLSLGAALGALLSKAGDKALDLLMPEVMRRLRQWWFEVTHRNAQDGLRRLERRRFDWDGIGADITLLDTCLAGYRRGDLRARIVAPAQDDAAFLADAAALEGWPVASAGAGAAAARSLAAWRGNAAEGTHGVYDNNDAVHVRRFGSLRDGQHEYQGFQFELAASSYCQHRAAVDLFARHLDPARRDEVLRRMTEESGDPFFGRNLAIALAVVTADSRLVFARRSIATAVDPGKLSCTVGEGVKVEDVEAARRHFGGDVALACAARGLQEEFNIAVPSELMSRLRFTAFGLSQEYAEWYLFGVIDLRGAARGYTAATIQRDWKNATGKDTMETSEPIFVPFSEPAVRDFIRRTGTGPRGLAEYAVVAAYLAVAGR